MAILNEHIKIGQQGECIAVEQLEYLGYTILARNWRYKKAEIDIIATHGSTLIFVEVKTRSYNYLGEPEDAVNHRKQDLLVSAASAYMREHNYDWAYRFDIVSIIRHNDQHFTTKHLIDAFEPRLID